MRVDSTRRAQGRKTERTVLVRLFLICAFVLFFAALYPYLASTGSCGDPGCPHLSHAPVPAWIPAGAVALLAAALAHRLRYRFASDRKPAEVYLSPEPYPPRP